MSEPFWLVWNPAGSRPPSFRHPTADSAVAEAGRLAELNAGETFFVLSAIGFASADKPAAHFMSLVFDDETGDFKGTAPPDASEPAGYLPLRVAVPVRELRHGEYRAGDRVRYTGRRRVLACSLKVGALGTVQSLQDAHTVRVRWDDERTVGVYPGNLEHESLPRFEARDRVRIKATGLYNVSGAAGVEGVVAGGPNERDYLSIRLDEQVKRNDGHFTDWVSAFPNQLELVRPVQAGSGS